MSSTNCAKTTRCRVESSTTSYWEAAIGALDDETQADMLEFLETGSSPRTRQTPKND